MGDKNIYDTAIQVRIRRQNETLFMICDEYEPVSVLKGRYLAYLSSTDFKVPKRKIEEETLTVEDVRFNLKKRVSNRHLNRF